MPLRQPVVAPEAACPLASGCEPCNHCPTSMVMGKSTASPLSSRSCCCSLVIKLCESTYTVGARNVNNGRSKVKHAFHLDLSTIHSIQDHIKLRANGQCFRAEKSNEGVQWFLTIVVVVVVVAADGGGQLYPKSKVARDANVAAPSSELLPRPIERITHRRGSVITIWKRNEFVLFPRVPDIYRSWTCSVGTHRINYFLPRFNSSGTDEP